MGFAFGPMSSIFIYNVVSLVHNTLLTGAEHDVYETMNNICMVLSVEPAVHWELEFRIWV